MSERRPYQLMPPLSAEEYAALKADIAERGVQVPVEYDEHGNVIDGHHRIQICAELGIAQWPRLVRHGLSEEDKVQSCAMPQPASAAPRPGATSCPDRCRIAGRAGRERSSGSRGARC
jgi:hypothetical protein